MTIKHRGVKIVPVKITRYEVRTVDGRKLMTFGTPASARAWINGYLKAFADLTPKPVEAPTTNSQEPPKRRRSKPEAEMTT
jgi:hypothetical protein